MEAYLGDKAGSVFHHCNKEQHSEARNACICERRAENKQVKIKQQLKDAYLSQDTHWRFWMAMEKKKTENKKEVLIDVAER